MALFGRRVDSSRDGGETSGPAIEPSSEEPMLSPERLRRHTERFKVSDGTPSRLDGAVGGDVEFSPAAALPDSLVRNAFVVLDIPLDAADVQINDAYDNLSFEPGHDPRALDDARARLMSARDRLVQELDWLPESSPETQADARAAIRNGDGLALQQLRDRTIGLARVNLAVAAALTHQNDVDAMINVIVDVQRWNVEATLNALDEARGRGRFRPIEPDQWDQAVKARMEAVATLVASTSAKSAESRAKLLRMLQQPRADGAGAQAAFLDAVMKHYAAGIDETLARLSARITDCAEKLRDRPYERVHATALLASLDLWSSYRLPIQMMEEARALDDPASASIFKTVRELSIVLSNDFNQHETALMLVRSLLHCFAHVPNCRQEMEQQMPTLIKNAAIGRLEQVCERAFLNDREFAIEVVRSRMEAGTRGIANQLVAVFEDTLSQWPGDPTPLFLLVRHLSIRLHNECGHHSVTPILMQWLLALDAPIELAAKIRDDLKSIGIGGITAGMVTRRVND